MEALCPSELFCCTVSRILTCTCPYPQNSCSWPLYKSPNVGTAAEKYLKEGPIWFHLWQWWFPWPNEINDHIAFLSSGERKKNFMVWVQVSMEGVAKWWPVVLPAPFGQAQSNVQVRYHVATASSSCVDDYNEMNCVDGEGSLCSGACLQPLLLGWISCEQLIPDESKNSSSITLPFDLSCRGFFFLGDDGDFQVAQCCFSCKSYRKHRVSSLVMILLRNIPSLSVLSIRSLQVFTWSPIGLASEHVEHCPG
jgi:hypothetical protein